MDSGTVILIIVILIISYILLKSKNESFGTSPGTFQQLASTSVDDFTERPREFIGMWKPYDPFMQTQGPFVDFY